MGKDVLNLIGTDFDKIISDNPVVVVDFWAPWCEPCKKLSPIFEEVALEHNGGVVFAKINFDECQEIAMRFRVSMLPTVCFFKNGKQVGRFAGLKNKKSILKFIEKYNIQ